MDILQAFGAIAFVLSLLMAVLFALRKRGIASFAPAFARGASPREMEVLERVPLGPQHSLHLVRVGEMKCLITTSPGACQLHTIPNQTD